MKRAVEKLKIKNKKLKINYLILDGNMKLDLPLPQESIVKADEKVFSCSAASIIAKIKRDKAMLRYHKKYPQYGFDQHKGYGTKQHLTMLNKFGPCAIHRNSFNYYGSPQTKAHKVKKE
jgi:ribonuclease HII